MLFMDDTTVYKSSPKAKKTREKSLSMKFRNRSIFIPKRFLIGRDDCCDIVLSEDSLVSRRHALIEFSQGEYLIKDLNSTNGTFVNGKPLQKMEKRLLAAGDVVRIGKTELKISAVPGQ